MSTLTPLDELLTHVDRALKAVFVTPTPARPMPQPGPHHDPNMALSDSEQRTAAALMRVNHAGEVAAQVTGLPQATPDQETKDLLSQTVTCYTAIHAPEEGDDKKKDDKNAE